MQYYTLISGLPEISLDDTKSAYTIQAYKQELDEILSANDKKVILDLFLKYDNENLLCFLNDKEAPLNELGTILADELADMIQEIKEVENPLNKKIPAYFKTFVPDYFTGSDALPALFWEDYLASLYYDYLGKTPNTFIKKWSELNLNINNTLIALACRKKEQDYIPYIIGNNEVAQTIRTSNARDFGLSELFEYFDEVRHIDEETNLVEKERKKDQLRWNWIDEKNFFNYFSIERATGFLLKLQMLSRWLQLNEEKGKQLFVDMVDNLKKGVTFNR